MAATSLPCASNGFFRCRASMPGCSSALRTGADFELLSEGRQAVSARRLWETWSFRHQTMLETGATPRPGLAEAVDKLQAAGASFVHLAKITSPQRRFVIFLAEDLTRCIACMG